MHWLLCLLAMLFLRLACGVSRVSRSCKSRRLGDLEANDVLAAIASFNATALGGWLFVRIALEM